MTNTLRTTKHSEYSLGILQNVHLSELKRPTSPVIDLTVKDLFTLTDKPEAKLYSTSTIKTLNTCTIYMSLK